MALQGSLGQLGLADVLQTALAGQSGGDLTLVRGAQRAVLHVSEEGLHLLEPDVLDPQDVLEAFVARGVLPRESLNPAGGKGGPKGLALLDTLVAQGALPEGDVLEVVAGAAEDEILDLLTWNDGTFRFEENTTLPERPNLVGRVAVDRGGVLLRAAQRIDERTAIAAAVGLHTRLFITTGQPAPACDEPDDPAPRVLEALDGRATIDEIALRLGISRFAALKAAAALSQTGAARPARPDELAMAVPGRVNTKQYRTARALALQWAEVDPHDPLPLRTLATLGEKRERPAEVVSALTLLGQRLLANGEAGESVKAFQDALERRPSDVLALEGLRAAADAGGDAGLWVRATLRLAQGALDGGDPARTAGLTGEVLARQAGDMGALLLQARAFTALKDREGVTQTAVALVAQLNGKAARRLERDAANFCRDAVALLAPERGDLLRTLRGLADGRQDSRRRRVALVAALVAALSGAGVVWWPESPSGLLDEARSSAEAGDKPRALELLGRLVEKFPESDEASEAFQLQAQILPPAEKKRPASSARVRGAQALPPLPAALDALPAAEALAQVLPHVRALPVPGTPAGAAVVLPPESVQALGKAIQRVSLAVRGRLDALALTADARQRSKDNAAALRKVIEGATDALDPVHVEAWKACLPALEALAGASRSAALQRELTAMPALIESYVRARSAHAADLLACRRLLAGLELEELHVACREQAPRLLVGGRLDDVERCYRSLEARLEVLAADPDMAPVLEAARRRLLPDFLRERQTLLRGIRSALAAAKSAEEGGDLEAAGKAYAAVAKRHYTVRFDDVIQVPLRIEASPLGAEVKVNGTVVGTSPVTIHYGWGVPVTVSVQAPGFEPLVRVLEARDGVPITRLDARLKPRMVWNVALEGIFESRPLPVGEDLLVCDRSGRVALRAGADGRELWARQLKHVEGVRARPAFDGQRIVLAFVDGRVAVLDARDGNVLNEEQVARPVGDVAALEGAAAFAVGTPAVVGFERGRRVWTTPLPAAATTSLVAGHGAFWLGTAAGSLVSVEARTGAARVVALPPPSAAVMALVPTEDGWLACLGDGRLLRLTVDGTLRWAAANLGDLGPAPVACAGLVAVPDSRGRVTLLDGASGAPRGTAAMHAEPAGGLLAVGLLVVATTQDGRLWVLDPATATVRVDATLSDKGLAMPTTLVGGDLAVVAREGRLLRVPAPTLPPPPAVAPPAPVEAAPVEAPAR